MELRATDDRLCPSCFRKNEDELVALRRRGAAKGSTPSTSTRANQASDSETRTKSSAARNDVPAALSSPAISQAIGRSPHTPSSAEAIFGANNANDHNTDLTRQDVTATSATVTEEISALRLLVHAQQATIKKLQSQLNFVLTFIGVDDTDIPGGVDFEDMSNQADAQNSKGLPAHHEASAPADKGANSDHQWSEVVKRHRHNQVDTFKQSLVTALYVDQSLKRSRENSLIVTGLVPVSTGPDTELFSNLCVAEFQMRPDIVSVKRIGQPRIGRVQPLLVHPKQTDQAKMLIDAARQLRSSSDPVVRERVFINPNLLPGACPETPGSTTSISW